MNDHYQAKTKGKNSKVYEKDVQLYENERTLDKRKKSNENLRPKSAIHNQSKK